MEEMILLMEKRADEREEKLIKLYDEMEEKRREKEREHELNITGMFFSFIERIAPPPPPPQQHYQQPTTYNTFSQSPYYTHNN